MDPMLAWAKLGIVCVSVGYRLAPRFKFPCQIEDVKCAVRWVRAGPELRGGYGPHRGVGGSGRARLVALLGTTSGSGKWEGEGSHAGQSSAVPLMVCHGIPSDLLMGYRDPPQQREPESSQVRSILTNFGGDTRRAEVGLCRGQSGALRRGPVHRHCCCMGAMIRWCP